MRRASELIICFNIKSAGCDLVGRHGGKWSVGEGDPRAHKQVATVETLPPSAPPRTRSASEEHPRMLCTRTRMRLYMRRARTRTHTCVRSRTNESAAAATTKGKRGENRGDYRWRDLIKHVDRSPANFTVRVSPLNRIFFVAVGLARAAPPRCEIRIQVYLQCIAIRPALRQLDRGSISSAIFFFTPPPRIVLISHAESAVVFMLITVSRIARRTFDRFPLTRDAVTRDPRDSRPDRDGSRRSPSARESVRPSEISCYSRDEGANKRREPSGQARERARD